LNSCDCWVHGLVSILQRWMLLLWDSGDSLIDMDHGSPDVLDIFMYMSHEFSF
jgi:hypothetical protein